MTTTDAATPAKTPTPARTPWHFWLVGIAAILWNGFGAYDYLRTNLQGDAYMRSMGMTDAQIAYFHDMPAWMTAVWAVGVWGGVLAGLLLLLRSTWALHVFVASLAAFVLSLVYYYVLTDGRTVMGPPVMVMQGVILVSCVFFVWYARRVTKQGVLR
ncbi:hypothetical protein [Phenylobacterium sp.]|uniref:hypothetical protein n=1 Tax=Phenylobacterium sp. TaxID=1871053 RepID=UPI00395CE695